MSRAELRRLGPALNKNCQALFSALNAEGQETLRKSEREWIKYRDSEFNFIDSITDSKYAGKRIENLQAKIDIVRKRAQRLEHQLGDAGVR